jgi:uncharacterized protein (DUF362 family)
VSGPSSREPGSAGPEGHEQSPAAAGKPGIDRRTFLRRSAEVGLGVAAAGLVGANLLKHPARSWDKSTFPPIGRSRVAVLRAASYDRDLEAIVADGLRQVGVDVRGKTVLLKPNLVEFDPSTAVNTDPRLVAAAVLAFRRLGAASVTVGEGPGHRRDTEYVVTRSGLLDALRAVEAPFVDLNLAALVRRPLHSHYTDLGELWLPDVVLNSDVVVSMPKMKTHHWGGVTLSLKNCFGCVPGRVYGYPKNVLHWAGLEQSIIDVAAAVRPDIAIVDGIVGMDGNGPISGDRKDAGLLVFGTDPVATDATAAYAMGVDPERVGYLAEAGRFLGQVHLDEVTQAGEDPGRVAVPFRLMPEFAHLRAGSNADATPARSGKGSGA